MKAYQIFIGINIFVFVLALLIGTVFNNLFGINYGYNAVLFLGGTSSDLVLQDYEVYRLLSAIFLHGGFLHLAVNMYSLSQVGPSVELIFKTWRFIVIYLISGLFGSVFSVVFQSNVLSVGASGAIMGLLGALGVWAVMARNKQLVRIILLNLLIIAAFGFTAPNIDNFGHLGGFVGGALISWIMLISNKKLLHSYSQSPEARWQPNEWRPGD